MGPLCHCYGPVLTAWGLNSQSLSARYRQTKGKLAFGGHLRTMRKQMLDDNWVNMAFQGVFQVPRSLLEPALTQDFLLHEIINFLIA